MLALVRQAFTGRYDVEREIGRGGNARIFLAKNPAGQYVALKILILSCWSASRPTVSCVRSSWPPSWTTPTSRGCSTRASRSGWSTTS